MLGLAQVLKLTDTARKRMYALAGSLTVMGIFAMRWNVVIGGQLFSKSFLGYTTYKMAFATREGSADRGRAHDSSLPHSMGLW